MSMTRQEVLIDTIYRVVDMKLNEKEDEVHTRCVTELLDIIEQLEQERDQLKESLAIHQRMLAGGILYSIDELIEHDAKVIDQFKDELVKSVNVMFKPHIEGVCTVVKRKLRQKAQEDV